MRTRSNNGRRQQSPQPPLLDLTTADLIHDLEFGRRYPRDDRGNAGNGSPPDIAYTRLQPRRSPRLRPPPDSRLALRLVWLAMRATAPISTRTAGYFAATLFFTPWRHPASPRAIAREQTWLAATRTLTLDTAAGRLHAYTAGDGPTILLLHGWGEHAGSMGAFVEPLVDAGYRVVGLDLPAHGRNADGPTDLPTVVGAIEIVAAQLGGVHGVVAHSFAGLATTIALRKNLDVDAAVLIAPAVRLEGVFAAFVRLFGISPRAAAGFRARLDRDFGDDVWRQYSGETLAPHISAPALIVYDDDDPQVAAIDVGALAAAWPAAQTLTTSGVGHTRLVRAPEVVAAAVDFLDQRKQTIGGGHRSPTPPHGEVGSMG